MCNGVLLPHAGLSDGERVRLLKLPRVLGDPDNPPPFGSASAPPLRSTRVFVGGDDRRWVGGIVPFEIDPAFTPVTHEKNDDSLVTNSMPSPSHRTR